MARMLDLTPAAEVRRPRLESAPIEPLRDEFDDDSAVPFIEVGAPTRGQLKAVREPSPAIIPMSPAVRAPSPPAIDAGDLLRIAFQPLPFPGHGEGPAERRFAHELVAFHQPAHEISEQYRRLVGELEKQLGSDSGRTILFASALPGAGTTTVLLNLALTCTRRVAVIDANLNRPALAERLGAAASPGMREVLARTVPLAWALQDTARPNLHVLAAGVNNTAATMDMWPLLLDHLRQRFDWVLIDGGPCGEQPEWPALVGTATATYLVLKQSDLESPELNETLADVSRQGGNLRGYVLTSS